MENIIIALMIVNIMGRYYNMTMWILARNDINFSTVAGLIRLHMPGIM